MIPEWRRTVAAALDAVDDGGSLHIVDFGRQERLPGWFKTALRAWLANSTYLPAIRCAKCLNRNAAASGASLEFDSLYRGYVVHAVLER